ncbi:MAG TPA: hypothetical protein VEZ11_17985 [Thermoanaerobaculia bacterium]|nr:hypothetical protein [Thermoanaerobaculia bacterium]
MESYSRMTLVSTSGNDMKAQWTRCFGIDRVVAVDDFSSLAPLLRRVLDELPIDVERVVIDHSSDALSCLEFLASLPHSFTGDVLFTAGDERDRHFLSSMGRGGDRVLYALGPDDLQFYMTLAGHPDLGEAMAPIQAIA